MISKRPPAKRPMTRRRFWQTFIKLPDPVTGALVTPTPHQCQVEVIVDLDEVDPATGLYR